MGKKYDLPVDYNLLTPKQRREVRIQYIEQQDGLCMYCKKSLNEGPPEEIRAKPIDWNLFPPHFLAYPIHLQHCHNTGMTEGAVHSLCNAVMWQYDGR